MAWIQGNYWEFGQTIRTLRSAVISHLSPLTSHLSPLTSHLSPLTSHLSPLTSKYYSTGI
ncbi:MAG: hypothetical protein ACI3YZ_11285 [Prevotella sp.]